MYRKKLLKTTAGVILLTLLAEIFTPCVVLALTSGPLQPEFTMFEPAGSSQMVDPFTGAFTYALPVVSVPGPHGSGYSMSLSYHSNMSPEEDASWVGYGWTLNPGSIVRSKNGTADDMNGEKVTYYNRMKRNDTWTVGLSTQLEVLDIEGIGSSLGVGGNIALRHNNYKGWSVAGGLFTGLKGLGSLGMNIDEGGTSFSAKINPLAIVSRFKKNLTGSPHLNYFLNRISIGGQLGSSAPSSRPTSVIPFLGESYSITPGVQTAIFLAGESISLTGSHSWFKPKDQYQKTHYGYMYSSSAKSSGDVMDYYAEKDKEYKNGTIRFLSIPFSGADQYFVSGEGMGGSFRLRHRQAGTFRPNYERSKIDMYQLGVELIVGDWGLSGSYGSGESTLTAEGWDNNNGVYQFGNRSADVDEGEPYFFRFYNDMGGSVDFNTATTDNPSQARTDGHFLRGPVSPTMNRGKRSGRSRYIGYHTNEEMQQVNTTTGGINYKSYNKRVNSRQYVDRSTTDDVFKNSIGEFAINGAGGNRYVYGLPVYARNEVSMAFGVQETSVTPGENRSYDDVSLSSPPEQMTGEKRNSAYATTYLLTEITTPDYVDRSNDGPSADDFGGYTKFNYQRTYGSNTKNSSDGDPWYKWREPYAGLTYQRNQLSDSRDNLGMVSYGEKEIYYLESVETKTHIAFFITNKTNITRPDISLSGSQTERLDAFEAEHDENIAAKGTNGAFPSTTNKLCYLERIQVYAKKENGEVGELLQTTHFAYDYSLMPNQPNSRLKSGGGRHGKLTLKKVWVENKDVVQAKITPYQFEYSYPSHLPVPYSNPSDPLNYLVSPYVNAEQNPAYAVGNIDRWGKYRYDGAERLQDDRPWIDQAPPPSQYDPAAWHLKRVILPSGGELQVQYEPHEYAYVQDRPAMAMVSLSPIQGSYTSGDDVFDIIGQGIYGISQPQPNTYKLNLVDIGLGTSPSTAELEAVKNRIEEIFIKGKEKLYFKFLYKLSGILTEAQQCPASLPTECDYEYIRGYANVASCSVDVANKAVYVTLGGSLAKEKPLRAAWDFKRSNNPGPDGYGTCTLDSREIPTGDPVSVIKGLANKATDMIDKMDQETGTPVVGSDTDPTWLQQPKLLPCYSYVRLPMTKAKRGGGVRVKRLLMYNPTGSLEIDPSAPDMLYGTEYLYETFENGRKISSGVATNEPANGREENSLVRLMYDDINAAESRGEIVAGENIVYYEGPFGESLLPGASIGYSRVTVRSIHRGVTNPGFSVYEYNTVRDHPTLSVLKSNIESSNDKSNPIISWLTQQYTDVVSATQGFSFIVNHMHGQPRGVYKYGGNYDESASTMSEAISSPPVQSQEYEYEETGASVPVMYSVDRPLRYERPGKEMEVVFEARRITDLTRDTPVQGSIAFNGAFPLFSLMVYFNRVHSELRTHTTTRIIDYPVMLKSVKSRRDGVVSKNENVVYDGKTGAPVVAYTTDGYHNLVLSETGPSAHNGGYYTYSIPAHMYYPDMGQKAAGERFIIQAEDEQSNTDEDKKPWSYPHVKVQATGSASLSARSSTGSKLQFVFSNDAPAGQTSDYQTPAILADVRNKLYDISTAIRPGSLVELRGMTKTPKVINGKLTMVRDYHSRGIFYIGAVNTSQIASGTPQLEYDLLDPFYGSLPSDGASGGSLEDVRIVEVIRSGQSNQLFAQGETVVTYGNDISSAIDYAKKIAARERYADRLNGWLAEGGHQGRVIDERDLTWKPGQPDAHDLINSKQLNSASSYADRYLLRVEKEKETDNNGKEVVRRINIGWWDTQANLPYYPPFPPTWYTHLYTVYKQSLPYTGKEFFGINDAGKLVYYTVVNNQTTEVNLNFQFRNLSANPTPEVPFPPVVADGPVVYPLTSPGGSVSNVLAAQAATYSDDWDYSEQEVENYTLPTNRNAYEVGERGKWRPQYSYVYRSGVLGGGRDYGTPNERVYKNAGTYTLSGLLNRTTPPALSTSVSGGWIRLNDNPSAYSISFPEKSYRYTPHGEALQQADILDIPSATRFAHQRNVPSIVAQNAEYMSIAFQSFEESDPATAQKVAGGHTGGYSYALNNGTSYTFASDLRVTSRLEKDGLSMRCWVKRNYNSSGQLDVAVNDNSVGAVSLSITPAIGGANLSSSAFTTRKIAQSGEWCLYEILIPGSEFPSANIGKTISFQFTGPAGQNNGYSIDDLRVQPVDAVSTCYVYDESLRLLTTFDDQHFGMSYQYNAEGIPVRTIKETVQGYKTISEGIMHLPKRVNRSTYADGGGAYSDGLPSVSPAPMLQQDSPWPQGGDENGQKGLNGKFDVLRLQLSPESKKLQILGSDSLGQKAVEKVLPQQEKTNQPTTQESN